VSCRVTKADTGEVLSAKRVTVRAIDALREYSRQTGKPPTTDLSRGNVLARMVHLAVDRLLDEIQPHPVTVDRTFEEGRAMFDDRTIARGIEFMKANRPRDAILLWEMVLEQDPDNTAAYYNLGIAYESLQEYEKAENAFRTAEGIKPKPRYSRAAEEAKAAALARLRLETDQ
jgi:tetratricopeptide (TPR) repeat protein